jgi:hypothetical protein
LVVLLDDRLGVGDRADQGELLRHRGLEPRGNVSPGNQQRVPGGYGEGVPKADDRIMLKEYAIRWWFAKGTWHRRSIGRMKWASMVAQLRTSEFPAC